MKFIKSYYDFILEKKEDFEEKIKGHGYYKGISVSTAREKAELMKKQSSMSDDNPEAYKELPGDTKGKKLLKKSQHTKDYESLYGDEEESKNESFLNEKAFMITVTGLTRQNKEDLTKMGVVVKQMGPGFYLTINDSDKKRVYDYLNTQDVEVSENLDEEASGDRTPIDNDAIEKGLKTKSEETGVPLELLRIVMRRGMAAWKSGHRPGAGQEQWGYARINSFLTKAPGTWGRPIKDPVKGGPKGSYGADADVAQEVIKGGYDKKLKEK